MHSRGRSIDKHGGFEEDELDVLRKSIVVWLPNGFEYQSIFKMRQKEFSKTVMAYSCKNMQR